MASDKKFDNFAKRGDVAQTLYPEWKLRKGNKNWYVIIPRWSKQYQYGDRQIYPRNKDLASTRWHVSHRNKQGRFGIIYKRSHFSQDSVRKLPTGNISRNTIPNERQAYRAKHDSGGNTNDTVLDRLNEAMGAWGIAKHRFWQDRTMLDFYKDAIGGIANYGLPTIRTNDTMDT